MIKYDEIRGFDEGLARVKLKDKWGFIDKKGREVIPVKFDEIWGFSEGLSGVELNKKWGLINKEGDIVIPIKYDDLGYSSEEGVYYLIEGLLNVRRDGKEGLIDKNNNC